MHINPKKRPIAKVPLIIKRGIKTDKTANLPPPTLPPHNPPQPNNPSSLSNPRKSGINRQQDHPAFRSVLCWGESEDY